MSTDDLGSDLDRQSGDVVEIINPNAASNILLVCEHASNYIPPHLNGLGLSSEAITSHAAWDPGALIVAKMMSELLDATVIAPTFSRLIYDCNRPPTSPTAMPKKSEIYDVPGNANLSEDEKRTRVNEFYLPYCNTLSDFVDARVGAGRDPVFVTIHSFTPVYHGRTREVEVGIIHDADARLAEAFLTFCGDHSEHVFRINDPYGPEDGVTHTLNTHAGSKGLHNAMVEIRNDLITDEKSQCKMAALLANCLRLALEKL